MRLRSSSRTARPSGHKTRPGTGSSTEHRRSQLPPLLTCRPPSRFGRSGSTSGFERSRSTSNPKSSWVWNGSRRFQVITGPSPGTGRNRRRASRHIGGTKRSPRPIPRNALPCCRSSESQPYSRRVAWLGLRPTACPSRSIQCTSIQCTRHSPAGRDSPREACRPADDCRHERPAGELPSPRSRPVEQQLEKA